MSNDVQARIEQLESSVRHMRIGIGVVVVVAAITVPTLGLRDVGSERMRQLTIEGDDGTVTIKDGNILIMDRGGHLLDLGGENIVMMSRERMLHLSTSGDEGLGFSHNGSFARLQLHGDDASLMLSGGKHGTTVMAGPSGTELALYTPQTSALLMLARDAPSASLELDGGKKLQLVATPDQARVVENK